MGAKLYQDHDWSADQTFGITGLVSKTYPLFLECVSDAHLNITLEGILMGLVRSVVIINGHLNKQERKKFAPREFFYCKA